MDLDDRLLHYLLVGVGIGLGSLLKQGFEYFASMFWETEYKAFRKWKKDQEQKATSGSK